jgi:hypothetical protein
MKQAKFFYMLKCGSDTARRTNIFLLQEYLISWVDKYVKNFLNT